MKTSVIEIGATYKSDVKVNVEEYIGHLIEAKIAVRNYFGLGAPKVYEGRFIYSLSTDQLFFLPKGSRSKGYVLEEENIYSAHIIKKDKKRHEEQLELYTNRLELRELEVARQNERAAQVRAEREERIENEKRLREEKEAAVISESKSLGGYEELEKEVIAFYDSFEGQSYNQKFVLSTYVPVLNKLIHKAIKDVNEYPKYYFGKNDNPKFCALIEKKLGIKLSTTQKASVEKLNEYLRN